MIGIIKDLVDAHKYFTRKGQTLDAAVIEDTAYALKHHCLRGDIHRVKIIQKGVKEYIKMKKAA